MVKCIPGTDSCYKSGEGFEAYKKMIELGDGISLGQICNITKLEPHLIQNWVKRGYVPHPINKKYYTKHLARILLINALRECMYIEDIGSLMYYINGDVDDESDDIISEEKLYKLFSKIIYEIDDLNKIENIVNKNIKNRKLNTCMKVMIYAYYSSEMSKKSDMYLQKLNTERS